MNNKVELLKTNRCRLLPPSVDYSSALFHLFNDITVKRFLPDFCLLFDTEKNTKNTIDLLCSNINKGYGVFWCIIVEEKFIGFIGITDLPDHPSIFFALLEEYRGLGYMEECIRKVQKHVCIRYGCTHIYTEIDDNNNESIQLLVRCGFIKDDNAHGYSCLLEKNMIENDTNKHQ